MAGQRLSGQVSGAGTLADVPDCFLVQLGRGGFGGDSRSFQMRPSATGMHADLPKWFTAQDVNGDGEVSMREFVGSRGQFEQIDSDADGFIEAVETAGR